MFLREINSVADIIFVIKESYPDAREIFKLHFIAKKMEEEDSHSTLDENEMIRCFERFSEAAGSLDEYEMRAMRDDVYMEFITETYKKYVVPLVSTYNSRMKKNACIINVAMQLATYLEMPDAYKVNLAIRKLLAAAERD